MVVGENRVSGQGKGARENRWVSKEIDRVCGCGGREEGYGPLGQGESSGGLRNTQEKARGHQKEKKKK